MGEIEQAVGAAVQTDVDVVAAEVKSLKSRMLALEAEGAGYVKAHMVYLMSAICLVVGAIGGYVIHR